MSAFATQDVAVSDLVLGSPQAELALLGELLAENSNVDQVADRLTPADFSIGLYGRIFDVMVREIALGRSCTAATLAPFFRDDHEFADTGATDVLNKAQTAGTYVFRTPAYVDQIISLSQRRRVVASFKKIASDARNLDTSIDDLLADADATLSGVVERADGTHEVTGAEALEQVMEEFGKPVIGVRCGIIGGVDDLLGPLKPGQLIVKAGRPGMGKTAEATDYGIGAASRGHGVLFVSLEMSAKELAARIAASMCFTRHGGVPFEVIRDRRPNASQAIEVGRAYVRLQSMPFKIVDRGSLKMGSLETLVRRYKRRMAAKGEKLELVIVDYLQRLRPDRNLGSKYEEISEISIRLKEIAKNQEVAVMALAQLSRAVEQRPDKRPMLSDLRDSGQIEQDADAVLFLYREAYYAKKAEPAEDSPEHDKWAADYDVVRDRIEFICAKRRDGPEGHALGYFFGQFQAVRGADFFDREGGHP